MLYSTLLFVATLLFLLPKLTLGQSEVIYSSIKIGHYNEGNNPTGCSVILFPEEGVTAGVDVRGGGPGTREINLLDPINPNRKIHAIALSGGSALGLDAASGVVRYLHERDIGYSVDDKKIPLVPAGIIYDFGVNQTGIAPNADCGYQAAKYATAVPQPSGNIGVGVGATVGKFYGHNPDQMMKGGFGQASFKREDGLIIAAVAVVNSFGDVINPKTNKIIAGVRSEDGKTLLDARKLVRQMPLEKTKNIANTTLVVVMTNAKLSRPEATKLAQMAQDGLARTIAPIHTPYDGDTVFAVSTEAFNEKVNIAVLGELAAQVTSEAIINAVCSATSLGKIQSAKQMGTCRL